MKAVMFDDYGGPEVLYLGEAPVPRPADGEVLMKVMAAAVNPADYKWRDGMFREMVPITFPHILGYDVAGLVEEVHPSVSGLSPGDRVVGMVNYDTKGGYAEYASVPAASSAKVPASLDLGVAAAIPTAGLTGVQMIEEHLDVKEGERVLITGACGAVGRFAVYAALGRGAHVVAAVRASQQDLATRLGAHEVAVLGEPWDGEPFDHVADTVGGEQVTALCHHLKPGGRIRTAATTPIDPAGLNDEPQFFGVHPDAARLAELAAAVAAGEIEVTVARRLPLAEAAEAQLLVEAGGLGGKVILEP